MPHPSGWIVKVLTEAPKENTEWVLWVDLDTIILDAHFVFPFKDFEDKDLVLWGEEEYVRRGDPGKGDTCV